MTHVTISQEAEQRLWAFVRAVKTEVGGWGYSWLQEDGSLHVDEVFLVPQIVSHAEVDFETTHGDVVAVEKAIKDGVLGDERLVFFSWHSHHTMKAYWSGVDKDRIDGFNVAGMKRVLSFVGSHDGTYKLRLDLFDVEAHGVNVGRVTHDELTLHSDPDNEFEAEIRREIARNVKTAPPQQVSQGWSWHDTSDRFDKQASKDADEIVGKSRHITVEDAFVIKEIVEETGCTIADAISMLDLVAAGCTVAEVVEMLALEDAIDNANYELSAEDVLDDVVVPS